MKPTKINANLLLDRLISVVFNLGYSQIYISSDWVFYTLFNWSVRVFLYFHWYSNSNVDKISKNSKFFNFGVILKHNWCFKKTTRISNHSQHTKENYS